MSQTVKAPLTPLQRLWAIKVTEYNAMEAFEAHRREAYATHLDTCQVWTPLFTPLQLQPSLAIDHVHRLPLRAVILGSLAAVCAALRGTMPSAAPPSVRVCRGRVCHVTDLDAAGI